MRRVPHARWVMLLVLLPFGAACSDVSADPTRVAGAQQTARALATKAEATVRAIVSGEDGQLRFPTGTFDGTRPISRDEWETEWGVLQAFDAWNDWLDGVCETRRHPDGGADCQHAGVDLQFKVNGVPDGTATHEKPVYPVAPGVVEHVFAWSDADGYPGDAILVRHGSGERAFYAMYAHIVLDPKIKDGWNTTRQWELTTITEPLGMISAWPDTYGGVSGSHLHFEIRNFPIIDEVEHNNVFQCGCGVGPGYWLRSLGGPKEVGWVDPIEFIEDSR